MIDKLLTYIRIKKNEIRLIGIDGHLGVGKTAFAEELGALLKTPVVHIDEYIQLSSEKQFQNSIDYKSLNDKIESFSGIIIIEGVCLLNCLKSINCQPDLLIYITASRTDLIHQDELADEVDIYHEKEMPQQKARFIMRSKVMTDKSNDIDLQYLKFMTIISVLLALGGILSLIIGGVIFAFFGAESGVSNIKLLGLEINAKGAGSILMGTSVAWAYLSYLARPQYNTITEKRVERTPEGGYQESFRHTKTQMALTNSQLKMR